MSCARCLLVIFLLFTARGYAQGPEFLYLLHCGGCHLEDGSGMLDAVPDLRRELGFFASTFEGRSYIVRVPGASQAPVTDSQLAEITNWMLARFAADYIVEPFDEVEVAAQRSIPLDDVVSERAKLLDIRDQSESRSEAEVDESASLPLNNESSESLIQNDWENLGRTLFSDTTLSLNGNQSCASCHDPDRAFIDSVGHRFGRAGSVGSDGQSIGDRNAPMLTYATMLPPWNLFDSTTADMISGGLFWDGRAHDLSEQVLNPFVNAGEMALTDLGSLARRVQKGKTYQRFLGGRHDTDGTISVVVRGLTSYLASAELNSFDSRYDRFLRGELQPTSEEFIGMALFFSPSFTNCSTCHQSEAVPFASGELFTNHKYENIGVPTNLALRQMNGLGEHYIDLGLAANPRLTGEALSNESRGRFRVPGLRNVAVTAPYMHNGVFSQLSTVLSFYNRFSNLGDSGQVNPETNEHWVDAEVGDTVAFDKLQGSIPLSPRQLQALQAFLEMLTDKRYEHLL